MNLSFFIARRLYFNEHSDRHISKLAINIATVGVTIGLAVMIVSVCVLLGFKRELTDKIVGFGSHIQILNANVGSSPESFPIVTDSAFVDRVKGVAHVEHVQRFSHKMGIIKTDDDFKGILLKGIGEDYDTRFLGKHLLEGEMPDYRGEAHRNDVLVSRATADQMHLKAGDKVYAYFFEDNVRTRLFRVAGIYQTNMSQFDDNIIIADIRTVNKLNNWRADQSSGLEIFTDDFPHTINTYIDLISRVTRDATDADGNVYAAFTIQDLYAQIFDWLKLLDLNVWVVLGLMACVACFTMISGLLILILERSSTIGVLKSIGARNFLIRNIFIHYAFFIMGRGIVLGNVIGLGLAYVQWQFHLFTLDATKSYVDHVPIYIHPLLLLLLTVATVAVCLLSMIGPSYLISKISPVKAIRFD